MRTVSAGKSVSRIRILPPQPNKQDPLFCGSCFFDNFPNYRRFSVSVDSEYHLCVINRLTTATKDRSLAAIINIRFPNYSHLLTLFSSPAPRSHYGNQDRSFLRSHNHTTPRWRCRKTHIPDCREATPGRVACSSSEAHPGSGRCS